MATVAFVSLMDGVPWGGSEDLWVSTASGLARRGHTVRASVVGWPVRRPQLDMLATAGGAVHPRPMFQRRWQRLWRAAVEPARSWPSTGDLVRFLRVRPLPDLVVLNVGGAFPILDALERIDTVAPFVIVSHANAADAWPDDRVAERLMQLTARAKRWYFVSQANRALAEDQLGVSITNAAIVRNPFNVRYDVSTEWPQSDRLRMANVGRLDPRAKGQHLLLAALATSMWKKRDWELNLYGGGPMRGSIERLVARHGLASQVSLHGHVDSIEHVWHHNHVLVLPSRYEGLPLALVEAMLCARPAVVTDVAGNREVVDDGVTGFIAEAPTERSIGAALERLWEARTSLQQMGQAAADAIRAEVPPDPVERFVDELLGLLP